jgi:hypothetical protein
MVQIRPEVPAAIKQCQGAGITVRMLTGHPIYPYLPSSPSHFLWEQACHYLDVSFWVAVGVFGLFKLIEHAGEFWS